MRVGYFPRRYLGFAHTSHRKHQKPGRGLPTVRVPVLLNVPPNVPHVYMPRLKAGRLHQRLRVTYHGLTPTAATNRCLDKPAIAHLLLAHSPAANWPLILDSRFSILSSRLNPLPSAPFLLVHEMVRVLARRQGQRGLKVSNRGNLGQVVLEMRICRFADPDYCLLALLSPQTRHFPRRHLENLEASIGCSPPFHFQLDDSRGGAHSASLNGSHGQESHT